MTHFEKLLFCSGDNLVTVELVYMQYNISDSQALFCFALILRMASQTPCFYAKIKAFVLIKKSVLYFSFNFTRVLASPILKYLRICTPCFEPNLCSLILIPSKNTVQCKMVFPPCPQRNMLQSKPPKSHKGEGQFLSIKCNSLSLFYSIVAALQPRKTLFNLVLVMGFHCDKNNL